MWNKRQHVVRRGGRRFSPVLSTKLIQFNSLFQSFQKVEILALFFGTLAYLGQFRQMEKQFFFLSSCKRVVQVMAFVFNAIYGS